MLYLSPLVAQLRKNPPQMNLILTKMQVKSFGHSGAKLSYAVGAKMSTPYFSAALKCSSPN